MRVSLPAPDPYSGGQAPGWGAPWLPGCSPEAGWLLSLLHVSGAPRPSFQALSEVKVGARPPAMGPPGADAVGTRTSPQQAAVSLCAQSLAQCPLPSLPSPITASFCCQYHVMLKLKTKDQKLTYDVSERVSQVQKPLFIILRKLS